MFALFPNVSRPMSQANFAYSATADERAGLPLALSVYADRPHLRATMVEDAQAAGLRIGAVGGIGELLDGELRALGDVVLLDCPQVDAAAMAALSRLDLRAAHAGAHLIVSTTLDGLDAVFACMDQSDPRILVDPNRAERVLALGEVMAKLPAHMLRELSEDDRLMLLRLSEQVGQIAGRIERLAPDAGKSAYAVAEGSAGFATLPAMYAARAPLPDPRLVRRIIRERQLRGRFLDAELFADPAWDMLLDLTAARAEYQRVSVTSLCIAAAVPPTTALRWIGQMVDAGLFERVSDDADKRRAFIALSDSAADAMARYFAEIGSMAAVSP